MLEILLSSLWLKLGVSLGRTSADTGEREGGMLWSSRGTCRRSTFDANNSQQKKKGISLEDPGSNISLATIQLQ